MTARRSLAAALRALSRALARVGKPYMLIGGVAVIARGVRRITQDVDAALWAEDVDVDDLLRVLKEHGISPRIPKAAEFARERQVLLLVHRPSKTPLDLSFSWLPFEKRALERAETLVLEGVRVRVASPQDLIIYKAVAWRERDRTDIERLLLRHAKRIDLAEVRSAVAEFARALEAPERVVEFDQLVDRAIGRPRRGRT